MLVVEDDGDLREMYRHALQFSGYAAAGVGDGLSALRHILNGSPPDLVVLDLDLPSIGGRDVRREMASRAGTRDIPVVVVTGTDTRDLSPTDYPCVLHKPIEPDELVSAVDECFKRPH